MCTIDYQDNLISTLVMSQQLAYFKRKNTKESDSFDINETNGISIIESKNIYHPSESVRV